MAEIGNTLLSENVGCCCCYLASSIAKMWCFAVSVDADHNDSTVSVVSFDIDGTLMLIDGLALPESAASPPKRRLTSRESSEDLAADSVGW